MVSRHKDIIRLETVSHRFRRRLGLCWAKVSSYFVYWKSSLSCRYFICLTTLPVYTLCSTGQPIGPTLRVKPGDLLTVTLNNSLPAGSSVDRELYDYTHNPQNEMDEPRNMTIIYNRLVSKPNFNSVTGSLLLSSHLHHALRYRMRSPVIRVILPMASGVGTI